MVAVLTLAGLLLQPVDGRPALDRVEPPSVPAYAPASVTLHGRGFGAGCHVLLGVPGRMVPVPSTLVDAKTLQVELRLGLPPEPAERQLVVDCGGGRVSAQAILRVEPRGHGQPATPPAVPLPVIEPVAQAAVAGSPAGIVSVPVLARLEPAEFAAGQTGILTLFGSGFASDTRVRILANLHAGTSRPPDYEMKEFAAELLSDTVLTVELDRGFAPSPRLRRVVVVNPDGGESAPLFLTVTRRKP